MKLPTVVKRVLSSLISNAGLSVYQGSWWPVVREPYTGAWQRNDELSVDCLLAYDAVFACITLIASDIAKLPFVLKQLNVSNGIWQTTTSSAYSPVLRKPNRFQNHIQFKEFWQISKLSTGNTYALKERDNRNVVVAEYVLDPSRVQVLVAENGEVYYQLSVDNLNSVDEDIIVPSSEIIHDRMNCLFHPLIGISPLFACALSATQGLSIQKDSETFFKNGARPSGILTAPGAISDATALKLKEHWDANYTGKNAGRVAVLGDSLKFEAMKATAIDSQLIEQLKMTAESVCSVFHVPPFKIGRGAIPTGQKVEVLNQIYYSDCLQRLIEDMELCQDEGLNLPSDMMAQLDLDVLLRMDTETFYKVLGDAIKGCLLKPNEARLRINLPPVEGGDALYLQQQNFSLAALAKRDALADPFATSSTEEIVEPVEEPELAPEEQQRIFNLYLEKELAL